MPACANGAKHGQEENGNAQYYRRGGRKKGHLGKYSTKPKSGWKGFGIYNIYSELKRGVEVAAVVPQAPPLCYERKQQCYDKHSSSHSKITPTKSELT